MKIKEKLIEFFWNSFAPAFVVISFCIILTMLGLMLHRKKLISDNEMLFLGSIIGGGITLLGVIMTIDHNNRINNKQRELHNKERKEDMEIMYQPIISARIIDYKEVNILSNELTILFNHPYFDDTDLETVPYMIELKNTGRGEINSYHAIIEDIFIVHSPFDPENELDFSDSYILGDGAFNFFPINGSNYMLIKIPKFIKKQNIDDYIRIGVSLTIDISGFVGTVVHEYKLTFYMDIPLKQYNRKC